MKEWDRDALEPLDRAALIALVLAQQAQLAALAQQVAALTARVEELGGTPPASPPAKPLPPFVKPSRPAKPVGGTRKKRALNFARGRATPTRVVEHVLGACPDCNAALGGGE